MSSENTDYNGESDEQNPNSSAMISVPDKDVSWGPYFRYESAYADQYDGIEQFLDVLKDNGFYGLEGPCGTGKTLIAITAALEAIRNDDYPDYERVGVFTPNKQQLSQFIEEMRGVNRSLPGDVDEASTVVMKGRADMMPYSFVDLPPFDRDSIGERADDLREKTREIIRFGSDIPLNWPADMDPPASAYHDYNWSKASSKAEDRRERYVYDPYRAECVRRILIDKQAHDDDYEQLVINGVASPYPDVVPHTRHIVDTDELQKQNLQQLHPSDSGKFDPFYAAFFAPGLPSFDFTDAEYGVLDRDTLFELAVSEGVCPHESMAHFAGEAVVVLGNYNHLFDPQTRHLTESKIGLFDEETIIVLDEAHRIESKVRSMLSRTLDLYTLDKAINDVRIAQTYAKGEIRDSPTPELDSDELQNAVELSEAALEEVKFDTVTKSDLAAVEELLIFLKQKLNELSADYLHDRFSRGWQHAVEQYGTSEEERPLTNVELPDADGLLIRQVKSRFDDGERRMEKTLGVFTALDYLYEYLDEANIYDREPQGIEVGEFCYGWVARDVIEYHREIVLEPSHKKDVPAEYPAWVREWTPKFQLYNCIPTNPLKDIFEEVGGGILMSATLSPPDVFAEAVGIKSIPKVGELETVGDEENTRRSEFDQFELRFPEENRLSLTVDLPKFTAKNRGSMTTNPTSMTQVRRQYADMIETIVESEGNILICMPKYAEAKWAYECTKRRTNKDLYLDQSSTSEETKEMLEQFFDERSDSAVFTSARGTITEGVDYDGSKLHCCAVIGIPMIDTRSERVKAIKYAYSKKIPSQDGFETAIKIPAVRKARQAIGRVIRGTNDVGVRLLVDERYGSDDWDGAQKNLSIDEQRDFEVVDPDSVEDRLTEFWSGIDREHSDEANSKSKLEKNSSSTERREDVNTDDTATEATSAESSDSTLKPPSKYSQPSSGDLSKIYLGSGSPIGSWIAVPKEVIESEIVPLVVNNVVDEDQDGIQVNSTKNVDGISGWDYVDKKVVLNRIVPIVKEYRF